MTESAFEHRTLDIASDEFFERARARLTFDIPPALHDVSLLSPSGDRGMDDILKIVAKERPIRPAAVLIGIVDHEKPTVLLTMRAAHLSDHAGQISFPGGKIDSTDSSPLEAALREAEEEIGLARSFVTPIGYLDLYATGFGFRILPTLARVQPGFSLHVNSDEVDEAFEVPLAFLMNPSNHQIQSREWRGIMRSFYVMPYPQRYIWGATAGILRVLYERILL